MNNPPPLPALAHLDTVEVPVFPGQEAIRAKYPRPPEVGEISGFGGGYEATCVNMMYAALQVLDEGITHEALSAKVTALQKDYEGKKAAGEDPSPPTITDAIGKDLEDRVDEAMMLACKRDCTGAMHGSSRMHAFQCINLGHAEYVRQLIEHHAKEKAEAP